MFSWGTNKRGEGSPINVDAISVSLDHFFRLFGAVQIRLEAKESAEALPVRCMVAESGIAVLGDTTGASCAPTKSSGRVARKSSALSPGQSASQAFRESVP